MLIQSQVKLDVRPLYSQDLGLNNITLQQESYLYYYYYYYQTASLFAAEFTLVLRKQT
jgi:hypothetical protein